MTVCPCCGSLSAHIARAGSHQLLRDGAATVGDLTDRLGATQQNISKHLGVLHQAGIVGRRKDGNFVRYNVADDSIFGRCEQVCGGLREQVTELDQILTGGQA